MEPNSQDSLPPIPAKRYFTIGEVSELCGVKPHVLRYWEQEFTQLKPIKRRGNRRYYQHHEVLLIRRIRELLYEQGFTINGARHRLDNIIGLSVKSENSGKFNLMVVRSEILSVPEHPEYTSARRVSGVEKFEQGMAFFAAVAELAAF